MSTDDWVGNEAVFIPLFLIDMFIAIQAKNNHARSCTISTWAGQVYLSIGRYLGRER